MHRIMAVALIAAASAPASAAERRYTVTDFDSVRVEGPFQVTLATGKAGSAVATGSSQALDGLSLKVEGRVLRVRPNLNGWGGYPGEGAGPLKIAVTTHSLKSAAVIGSGGLQVDKARAMAFDASVAGSGRVGIDNVEADTLKVALMGSGKIELGGKAKQLTANIQGGGDLSAKELTAEDAVIGADTAGTIGVAVRRTAKVTATGAGDVEIVGTPACTVDARGAGRVLCGKAR
jgi:hypothetical protein